MTIISFRLFMHERFTITSDELQFALKSNYGKRVYHALLSDFIYEYRNCGMSIPRRNAYSIKANSFITWPINLIIMLLYE